MRDEISDEALKRLVEKGREDIAHDPDLAEKVRVNLSSQMDDLVARILDELGRGGDQEPD